MTPDRRVGVVLVAFGLAGLLVVDPVVSGIVFGVCGGGGCGPVVANAVGEAAMFALGLVVVVVFARRLLSWRVGAGLFGLLAACSLAVAVASSVLLAPYVRGSPLSRVMVSCWSWSPLVVVLTALLVAPLAEETCFRGLLQYGLSGVMGRWPALIVSAAVFGAVHAPFFGVAGAVVAFVEGILLGLPVAVWESLPASMALHALANLPGILALVAGLA